MSTDAPTADAPAEPVADALVRPLTLPVGDADVVIVAELLCGRARGERFKVAPSSATPSPDLRLALARTLAVGTLGWLVDAGQAPRTVLRAGRPVEGRAWDAALHVDDAGAPFSLRFSPAPVAFLLNLCVHVLPLVVAGHGSTQRHAHELATRALQTRARPTPATMRGDHAFYALAHENAGRLGLEHGVARALRAVLRRASPLSALFAPDDVTDGCDGGDDDVATLVGPGAVRVLELLEGPLGLAWARTPRALLGAADVDELVARADATVRRAGALVQALDVARRLDLLAPVVALVTALPEAWAGDVRARLLRVPGAQTMADRDRGVDALRRLADVGGLLDDVRARLGELRYGDERFAEARLTLALLRDRFAPHRDALASAVRKLTGVVG